jgi:parallel beta-helix repeat protein
LQSHRRSSRLFFRRCLLAPAASLLLGPALAVDYHVDPATGSMNNPGTSTAPWSTLAAVFSANKTFAPGDRILLRSGYHGSPVVKGNNAGNVTIMPAAGATPRLRLLDVASASRWVITGLDVCPEHAGAGQYLTSEILLNIQTTASRITIDQCRFRGALSNAGWTEEQWKARVTRGGLIKGPHSVLTNNIIETSSHGLAISHEADFSVVSGNTIRDFTHDGMNGHADDCLFENNLVTGCYLSSASNGNHDDLFQSTSRGPTGTAGGGTVYRVTLRGNRFICYSDPANPLQQSSQGISGFDGMYEGWVIENNLVVSNHANGIVLNGAINCRMVNNTVAKHPAVGSGASPWIQIHPHKNGTPASGNIIRNNYAPGAIKYGSGGGVLDHNLQSTSYTTHFTNYALLDFTLKSTSSAVGGGSTAGAPTIDILGRARTVPYDIGAFEHVGTAVLTPYQQWLLANGLPSDGSGAGAKGEDPLGDGVANEVKYALGLTLATRGYGGRLSHGMTTVSGGRYLSLTYIRPEPAPSGATYSVQVGPDLGGWSAADTVQVSSSVAGGLRTTVVRDIRPVSAAHPQRFIRLEAGVP